MKHKLFIGLLAVLLFIDIIGLVSCLTSKDLDKYFYLDNNKMEVTENE